MAILMLIILIGFMATMILVSNTIGFGSAKKSIKFLHICLIIACILIAGLTFGHSMHATNMVVDNAEQVGLIKPVRVVDTGTVYYDSEMDKYFIVQSDIWNPITPAYRTYLDQETAEQYVDSYSKLMDDMKEG